MKVRDYVKQYDIAKRLAEFYHKDQVDIGGHPYIEHVKYVSDHISDYFKDGDNLNKYYIAIIAGYLHDIMEDCNVSANVLSSEGISKKVIDVLKILTHDKSISYKDYIINISKNEIATLVKLSDLSNNMDIRRLKKLDNNTIRRLKKYFYSYKFLLGEISEEKYISELEKI